MMGPCVLLIDDDNVALHCLEKLMTKQGYKCHLATSGYDGLQQLQRLKFDAVICDIIMPGIDGYQVLDTIKQQYGNSMPVAVMSATESTEEMEYCSSHQANVYLKKPISVRDIRALSSVFR